MGRDDLDQFPTPVVKILRYLGIGILVWFPVVFILTFAVPAGRYYTSKPEFGEKKTPDAKMIAFHWMTMIGGILVGVSCVATLSWHHQCYALMGSGIFWLLWYLLYIGYFYVSEEYRTTWEVISLDGFNDMDRQAREKGPQVELYGTGTQYSKKSHSPCETEPTILKVATFESHTEPLNLTEEQLNDGPLIIETTVKVSLIGDKDTQILNDMKNKLKNCMNSWGFQRLVVGEPRWEGGSPGYKKLVIVTKDGKKPGVVHKSNARTAGFFAAGMIFLYDIDRIPRVKYSMSMTATLADDQAFDCAAIKEECVVVGGW